MVIPHLLGPLLLSRTSSSVVPFPSLCHLGAPGIRSTLWLTTRIHGDFLHAHEFATA